MKKLILKSLIAVLFASFLFVTFATVNAADDPEPEFAYPAKVIQLADDPEPEFAYPTKVIQLADDPEPEFEYPNAVISL